LVALCVLSAENVMRIGNSCPVFGMGYLFLLCSAFLYSNLLTQILQSLLVIMMWSWMEVEGHYVNTGFACFLAWLPSNGTKVQQWPVRLDSVCWYWGFHSTLIIGCWWWSHFHSFVQLQYIFVGDGLFSCLIPWCLV